VAVLNGVIPVFLIVGLGVVGRRLGWIDRAFVHNLNRIIYWFAIPALMLRLIGTARLGESFSMALVIGTCGATIAAAVPIFFGRSQRSGAPPRRGVLVQAAVRGNLVFVGFPVIFAAAGQDALAVAAVTVAVLIPFQNVISVAVLAVEGEQSALRVLRDLLTNPVVLGAAGGIVWAATGFSAWTWLENFLMLVGNIAMPGALLALGGQLDFRDLRGDLAAASAATFLKVVVSPAVGLISLGALGVGGLELLVGVLLLATPTAVASIPVAQEMGGDQRLAGACVMASSIASLPAFVLWGLLVS